MTMNCHAEGDVQQQGKTEVFTSSQIVPPGKDGEPLPSQDKTIAQYWPVEFREFIERVEKFFSGPWPRYFTEQEIEQALHMKLVSAPERVYSGSGVEAEYWIVGIPFVRSQRKGVVSHAEIYTVMKPDTYLGADESQAVRILLPIETNKYCINPYDFAIYNSAKARIPLPIHPPLNYVNRGYQYEWGMFRLASRYLLMPTEASSSALMGWGFNVGTDGHCLKYLEISALRDIALQRSH